MFGRSTECSKTLVKIRPNTYINELYNSPYHSIVLLSQVRDGTITVCQRNQNFFLKLSGLEFTRCHLTEPTLKQH